MKKILFILLSLYCVTLSAQEIISQSQELISSGDTLYFIRTTIITDNGTPLPDTSTITNLLGDSTVTADYLFDLPFQQHISVATGMQLALKRAFASSTFNAVNSVFQSVTGLGLYQESGNRYFASLEGRYRVFDNVGGNFFAKIIQVGNGTLRLDEEGGDGLWIVQALGPNAFVLQDFDHNNDATTDDWFFYWDGISSERKAFWPVERVSGRTTIFRIVKVEQ